MRKLYAIAATAAIAIATLAGAPAQAGPSQGPANVNAVKGMHPVPGKVPPKQKTAGKLPTWYMYNGPHQFVGSGAAGVGADAAYIETSQHKTWKDTGDAHTLWEFVAESSDNQQIVEVGWTMDTAVCGQSVNPCLFVYHWVNGNNSCYNGCGWVDNPTEAVNAGTALASTPGGSSPTSFTGYKIEHASSVKCDDVAPVQTTATPGWVISRGPVGGLSITGCFPDALWTGATPSATFNKVQVVQSFNEIASQTDDHPCTDMGSGIFAPASAVLSASQWVKNYALTNPPAGVTPSFDFSAPVVPSLHTPTATRLFQYTASNDYRVGGPMWNSTDTGTGTASAC